MNSEEDNKEKLKGEAYRLSELSLDSDASAADAADQRAMGFCALLIAAAAVLTGLVDAATPNLGLLLAALVLAIAAGIAGYSARPRDFYFPGARYDDLEEDISNNVNFYSVVEQLGGYNDKHTRENGKLLKENARLLAISYWVALLGLGIAIVSQFVLTMPICVG